MERHDFSEFYSIGGPIIEANIKTLINDLDNTNKSINTIKASNTLKLIIMVLLELSDDAFENICLGIPTDIGTYRMIALKINPLQNSLQNSLQNHEVKLDKVHIKLDSSMHTADFIKLSQDFHAEEQELTYIEFASACISDINLIRRCHDISSISLNNMIRLLIRNKYYINLDIESCKLLYECKYNINDLLYIAEYARNYESIRFIIDNMTAIELNELITHDGYFYENLISILIIDKIHTVNDKRLKTLLRKEISEYNFQSTPMISIIQCYYMIKYTTLSECINIIAQHNQKLDIYFKIPAHTASYIQYKKLYNDMLAFHLRPRGGYTKGAAAF
jgi:hypothetical protein